MIHSTNVAVPQTPIHWLSLMLKPEWYKKNYISNRRYCFTTLFWCILLWIIFFPLKNSRQFSPINHVCQKEKKKKRLIASLVNKLVLCIFRCLLPCLCTMESIHDVERSLTGRSSVLLYFFNSFCLEKDVSCIAVRGKSESLESPPIKAKERKLE